MLDSALKLKAAACAAGLLIVVLPLSSDDLGSSPNDAKNVIVLIADGGGFNHFDAARLYETGQSYRQATVALQGGAIEQVAGGASQIYDLYPVQLAMSTYSSSGRGAYGPAEAWSTFDWVLEGPTDSAASATALSTGFKTANRVIGIDSEWMHSLTAGERALAAGKKVGLVTSVAFNHATPAAFITRSSERSHYHDIATSMIDSGIDVIIGAGHPGFDDAGEPRPDYFGEDSYISEDDYARLVDGATPYAFVDDNQRIKQIAAGQGVPKKLFGLAPVASTLQYARPGWDNYDVLPFTDSPNDEVPSLATAARAALQVLDGGDGFFLMVEGGAVDWAAHANHTTRMLEEQLAFNEMVEVVDTWVREHSSWQETLVIVTADHETGYLTGPGSDGDVGWTALTGEAGELPNLDWHTEKHTNSLVPLHAKGAGASCLLAQASERDPVRGPYLDNTDVGVTLQQLVGGRTCG